MSNPSDEFSGEDQPQHVRSTAMPPSAPRDETPNTITDRFVEAIRNFDSPVLLDVLPTLTIADLETFKEAWLRGQSGELDPTNVLCAGDYANQLLELPQHAMVLYEAGLEFMHRHPESIANDTDCAAASLNLINLLVRADRQQAAAAAAKRAGRMPVKHPTQNVQLAFWLGQARDAETAYTLFQRGKAAGLDVIAGEMGLSIADLNQMEDFLASAAGRPQCKSCGVQAEPGDEFCSECGGKMERTIAHSRCCPDCGNNLHPGDEFCDGCGSPIHPPTEDVAPAGFWDAMANVFANQWDLVEHAFRPFVGQDVWGQTARAMIVCALTSLERSGEAILEARQVDAASVLPDCRHIFYGALAMAYNTNDDLELASNAAEQGLAFLKSQGALDERACALLSVHANVLKQIASPLSRDPARLQEAARLATQAIEHMCVACSFNPEQCEGDEEEVQAIVKIAARAGVQREDLKFLDRIKNIDAWRRHFDADSMRKEAVVQCYNAGLRACRENDFKDGVFWFERAASKVSEGSDNDRIFKAMVNFNLGWALLDVYALNEPTFRHGRNNENPRSCVCGSYGTRPLKS